MRSSLLLAACLAAPATVLAYGERKFYEPNAAIVRAAALSVSKKAATSSSSSLDEPIAPSADPWYSAPSEFEHEAPGTILRVRSAAGNLTTIAGNASAAYNILYRTTNSRYQPAWAVTTLFVPTNGPASGTNGSLLSYQIPYDSYSVDASPSYALYAGVDSDIADALGKGYYVSVPDYEGPDACFTAGVLSGHATLDSVRAILSTAGTSRFGLAPSNTTVALWGYSGGALASEWAAELQVQYAPELNISGVAAGGLTPNITSTLVAVNGNLAAGLIPASILGFTYQFPDVYDYVLSLLKTSGEYNRTAFLATQNYTLDEAFIAYLNQDIGEYFNGGLASVLSPQALKIIHNDGIMGNHGIPQMPLYVYKAIEDEIAPIDDTDSLIDRYCTQGANILYDRMSIGGHTAGSSNGRASATAFLDAIFTGGYASAYSTSGCTTQVVAYNVSSSAI